jgi:hypothetical protein
MLGGIAVGVGGIFVQNGAMVIINATTYGS